MAINFQLARARELPAGDPLGHAWVGWREISTDDELWERNRGLWALAGRVGVLSDVVFLPSGEIDASSGTFRVFAWNPDTGALKARAYDFTPGAIDGEPGW